MERLLSISGAIGRRDQRSTSEERHRLSRQRMGQSTEWIDPSEEFPSSRMSKTGRLDVQYKEYKLISHRRRHCLCHVACAFSLLLDQQINLSYFPAFFVVLELFLICQSNKFSLVCHQSVECFIHTGFFSLSSSLYFSTSARIVSRSLSKIH